MTRREEVYRALIMKT